MNKAITKFLALVGGVVVFGGVVIGGLQLWGEGSLKPLNWGNHAILPDAGDNNGDNNGDSDNQGGEDETPIDECVISVMPVESSNLMALRVSALSLDDGIETQADTLTSKLLTANISTTIDNPKVDWSVEREDGSSVTEVTVVPTSDGALTATVTCKSAFNGTIRVKGEIRGLGVYAYANIIYEGIPSSISTTSALANSGGIYRANSTGNYSIAVNLSNTFGQVGSKYNDFEIVSTTKGGSFSVIRQNYTWNFGLKYPSGRETVSVSFADVMLPSSSGGVYEAMTFSILGNNVVFSVAGSITSYSKSVGLRDSDPETYTDTYESGGSSCYYQVTVREKTSGLSTTFKVGFSDAMLSTLSFDNTEIVF